MKTKYNKNGTVSLLQIPKTLYYAIESILASSRNAFEWNEEEGEWWSNTDFICWLSPEEKEELDKKGWRLW